MSAAAGLARAPAAGRPSLDAIWDALGQVLDPEIPVVSIVELGIVRGVRWIGDTLHVRVTPTYSGCPATDVIHRDIREALARASVTDVALEIALAPPWTTDWIAPEGKRKLREHGIAPPGRRAPSIDVAGISPLRRKREVPCPRCNSTSTSLVAQFGSTACKALYRCEACREPFDHFKPF